MKKMFLYCCLIAAGCTLQAQSTSKVSNTVIVSSDSIDKTFIVVEFESEFPGGIPGWTAYLQEHLKYPSKAIRKEIQGTVVLQFIVCTDGSVCNIEAVSGPEELRKAAIDALKSTPNWVPAQQNGRKVKSFKRQPITFKLTKE